MGRILNEQQQGCKRMRKHRLIVISDLAGGGTQWVLSRLLPQWLAAGHRLTVVTLAGKEHDAVALDPAVNRIALNMMASSGSLLAGIKNNFRRIIALRNLFREQKPDIIISFIAATNIISLLATIGLSIPVVISERNDPTRQVLALPWQLLRRGCYGLAEKVTANSQFALTELSRYVKQDKLAYVPNPLPQPSTLVCCKEKFLLAVGRLHPQKGYDVMLSAFANSQAVQLGWRLKVLGAGYLLPELQVQCQQLGIADDVDWLGYQAKTANYYLKASAFIITSHYEGMPNVLLEAANYALPIIASASCEGAKEILQDKHSCLFVPAADIDAFATAIDTLVLMPVAKAQIMGRAAQQVVQQQFSEDAIQTAWQAIFEELEYV